MKSYRAGVAAALLALLVGTGLPAANPGKSGDATQVIGAQFQDGKVSSADSLSQFVQKLGYKDARVITPSEPNQAPYCLFTYKSGSSKLTVKGYGFATEPVVELYSEVKVPPQVTPAALLKVLELTGKYVIFYRSGDNRLVTRYSLQARDLHNMPKYLDGLFQTSQQVYIALNPANTIE